jgi:hypothetical protein
MDPRTREEADAVLGRLRRWKTKNGAMLIREALLG